MSTTSQTYQFQLSLKVVAPFLSHKAGAQSFGYDMSMLKHQGHPVFLGSLIRGNLRHALLHFQEALSVKEHAKLNHEIKQVLGWFGQASSNEKGQGNKPERANFKFDYYWQINNAKDIPKNKVPRYRIGIDPKTGVVQQGNLQVIEAPYKQGQCVTFSGNIYAQLTPEEAELVGKWLEKAASYIPAIGALKGTGFGQIKTTSLKKSGKQSTKPSESINKERIGIAITLDRPLCIAKPHIPNHNRFSSEEFIPGNVILGCIAEYYPEVKQQSWFNQLTITHAFPADETKPERKSALPLSLVIITQDKKTIPLDLALSTPQEGKALMVNLAGKRQPPTYQPDWKNSDTEAVKAACYQNNETNNQPSRQLIVRTAIIERENNAKEGALFSLDCISPEKTVWCADIDFSAIEEGSERQQAQAFISKVIANGLQGIGKTKAYTTLTKQEAFSPVATIEKAGQTDKDKQHYIITLQTPARLFPAPNTIKATADANSLKKCYEKYWQDISGKQLTLSHYYAQQSKVGGEFYWRYYQQGETYQSEWLTNAGSVFVLTASDSFNELLLTEWLKRGLPQAEDKEASNWQNNPYIRENGFGEIHLNDAIHTRLSLQVQNQHGEWL